MSASSTAPNPIMNLDPRIISAIQHAVSSSSLAIHLPTIQQTSVPFLNQQLPQVTTLLKPPLAQHRQAEITLHSSPAREEGEVPESELDPDTRRRLLILQHGQDVREHPPSDPQIPARPPMQVPAPRVHPHGWFPVDEQMSTGNLNRVAPSIDFNTQSLPIDKNRTPLPPFLHKMETAIPPGKVPPGRVLESQRFQKKVSGIIFILVCWLS